MKISTIKSVLRKKIDRWADTIEDEKLKEEVKDKVIVSGGAITSMLLDNIPNDYDLYFKDLETTIKIAEYYVNWFNKHVGTLSSVVTNCNPKVRVYKGTNINGIKEDRVSIYMKSAGVAGENQSTYDYFEGHPEISASEFVESLSQKPFETTEALNELLKHKDLKKYSFRPVFFTDNAISLSNKVQLIIRFFGEASQIHNNYDFVHCMCYYDYKENELVLPSEALQAILGRSLIYKGSLYPVASIFRLRKFIKTGWRITAGQLIKILVQISKIDLTDVDVLREQLIGVDLAYMKQLLSALESVDKSKVDEAYITKLVDEIFEE